MLSRRSLLKTIILSIVAFSLFHSSVVFATSSSPFCGPQVLTAVLEKFNRPLDMDSLETTAQKQYGLTSFADLSKEARRKKLFTWTFKDGDLSILEEALRGGYVIINNRGHFALIERNHVVCGFPRDEEKVMYGRLQKGIGSIIGKLCKYWKRVKRWSVIPLRESSGNRRKD